MEKENKKPLGKKKYLLLGLLFALGLSLLLFSGTSAGKETASDSEDLPDAEAYRLALTKEVEALCRQVKGVGRATVLVSLSGGYEYVYARDGDGDCVSVGSGSGKQAVVESILPPRIAGIGIVCEGGGNAAVREALTALLSAALGVGTNKIYITS
ncbi:MAG: hypothetical protein E7606_03755 [Ruminococcaceae bacterium]|nr:hypothetical protein [Oscillospiraceae bacterium]